MLIEALVVLATGANMAFGGASLFHKRMLADYAQKQYKTWLLEHQSDPSGKAAPPPLDSAWWRENVTLTNCHSDGSQYVDINKFHAAKLAYNLERM